MRNKISVYVDDDLHRALKASASLMGMSLSEYMVEAARRMLHSPQRKVASSKMDQIRASISGSFTIQDVLAMREEEVGAIDQRDCCGCVGFDVHAFAHF